jgi:deoxyribose-phosphate aldolase
MPLKRDILKAVAQTIDQTNIRRQATAQEIKATCQVAKEWGFRGVCVNPDWVSLVRQELTGTEIKVICLIDPPLGVSPNRLRVQECEKAKLDGAEELDVVMNIVDLKYERHFNILGDLKSITPILPTKVIIGSGYLTDEEIKKASELVKQSGAICVKTATEKDPLGYSELTEKARHVRIMREFAPGLLVKAAGGIKTLADYQTMREAGADLIGTSFGVEIMEELNRTSR